MMKLTFSDFLTASTASSCFANSRPQIELRLLEIAHQGIHTFPFPGAHDGCRIMASREQVLCGSQPHRMLAEGQSDGAVETGFLGGLPDQAPHGHIRSFDVDPVQRMGTTSVPLDSKLNYL
jgi:hypothetical protein